MPDELKGQGHRSKVKVARSKNSFFRQVDLCWFPLSCHMTSCDVTTWHCDIIWGLLVTNTGKVYMTRDMMGESSWLQEKSNSSTIGNLDMIHLYIWEMRFDCSLICLDGQLKTTEGQIKCISMFHKIYLQQFLIVENNFLLRKHLVIDRNRDLQRHSYGHE